MDMQATPRYARMRGVVPPTNTVTVLISRSGRTVTLHFEPPKPPVVKVHDSLGERDIAVELKRQDAVRFVAKHWPRETVDWVFMDPPYGDPAGAECLAALGGRDTARIGWLVHEGPPAAIEIPEGFSIERVLDFGDSRVTLLRGGLRP